MKNLTLSELAKRLDLYERGRELPELLDFVIKKRDEIGASYEGVTWQVPLAKKPLQAIENGLFGRNARKIAFIANAGWLCWELPLDTPLRPKHKSKMQTQTEPEFEQEYQHAHRFKQGKRLAGRKTIAIPPGCIPTKRIKKDRDIKTRAWDSSFYRQFRDTIKDVDRTRSFDDKRNNDFYQVLVEDIISPLIHEYAQVSGIGPTGRKHKHLFGIAHAAALEAVKRNGITINNLNEKRTIVENYVKYALLVARWAGEGKPTPVKSLDFNRYVRPSGIDFLAIESDTTELFGLEGRLSDGEYKDIVSETRIREKALALLRTGRFNHPFGPIFVTQELRDSEGLDITPDRLLELLPEDAKENVIPKFYTSLDNLLLVREVLNEATPEQLSLYGSEVGIYRLTKQIQDKKGEDYSLPLSQLSLLLRKKRNVISLMNTENASEKLAQINWNPKYIELTMDQIENTLKLLKNKYEENPDIFFRRYGAVEGGYNLAKDINFRPDIRRLVTLTGNPRVLKNLLGINDPRFDTSWTPQHMFVGKDDIDAVALHLKKRYERNAEAFFEVYGSDLGILTLAKELQLKGFNISTQRLATFVSNGRGLERILEVEDPRFERDWRPRVMQLELETVDKIVEFLRQEYLSDPDRFFEKYGNEMGTVEISKDFNTKSGLKVKPENLHDLTSNGRTLTSLLAIKDERFERWKHKRLPSSVKYSEEAVDLLVRKYREDRDRFFERYGSKTGMYNLALDLRSSGRVNKEDRISINILSSSFANPRSASSILGITDDRFNDDWNPRNLHLDLESLESILETLRQEHQTDPDSFFERYGSTAGAYILAKKLREEGINLHLLRLGTVINKGEILSDLLGIEDKRFGADWKPREISLRFEDVERILAFLKREYQKNPDAFFERYGTITGQLNLSRDLQRLNIKSKTDMPITMLNGLTRDGPTLAKLLGIEDKRFSQSWTTTTQIAKSGSLETIIDVLKEKYAQDPDLFFTRYGSAAGSLNFARDLYEERHINTQLTNLESILINSEKISVIIGVDDERFKTEWHPKHVGNINYLEAKAVLEFLSGKYYENRNEFFSRYGSPIGVLRIAEDLEKEKGVTIRSLYGISTMVSGNGKVLRELINPEEDGFEIGWNPRALATNLKETRRILNHLKRQYELSRERFASIYGSRLRFAILARELGMPTPVLLNRCNTTHRKLQSILGNPRILENLLGLEENELTEDLPIERKRGFDENIVIKGLDYLVEGRTLPDLDEPITDEMKDYLSFRRHIRGISRDALLRFVELSAPQYSNNIRNYVNRSIEEDRRLLEELAETPDLVYRHTGKRGRKKCSKTDLIRLAKEKGVKTLTEWDERPDLPSRGVIETNFGGWKNFMDVVGSTDITDLPEETEISYEDYNSEVTDFLFKAGRLMYSFDLRIRMEAKARLISYVRPVLKSFDKKDIPYREKAFDLLEKAVEAYDVYRCFHNGENKVNYLSSYARSYINYAFASVAQDRRKRQEISIERDGLEVDGMHEDPRSILETLV